MAKRPELEFPENGSGDPTVDVWQSDGTFDSHKAETIFEETKNWPPEQRAAMLRSLRAAETRATVRTKYRHPAEMAAAVTPGYRITPALAMISTSIERVLNSHRKINLSVSMPPQEGKSSLCSVWAPLRALQLNPNRRIILATYAQPLADMHSRTAREVINTHGAGITDPLTGLAVEDKIGLRLAQGANKISFWSVEGGAGGLLAAGIGATITGMPADLLIIDDPFKNMMEADSATHRANVELWFSSVALTRLAPDASIILIQCMTGDTPVLRPDGTETPLADIRPGDEIATYENGALSTSTVKNWASQGYDSIYAITTKSGRTVRANARHPFLVLRDGVETWVRVSDLRPCDNLMATAAGTAQHVLSAISLSPARGCACLTTTKCDGPTVTSGSPQTSAETAICGTDTASALTTTTGCSPSKAGSAQAVASRPAPTIAPLIGRASYASIIAMKQDVCAAFSAMTATSSSVAPEQPCGCVKVPTISTDTVVAIEPCGVAEVFDIEVERTENFIANGLVSHNTRWHPEDLAGKVLAGEKLLDPSERTWRHLNIPAIAEEGIPDALGREPGTPMVSARDTPEAKRNFAQTRKQVGERTWYALYQGSPRNPAGGIFQRAWFDPRLPQPPSYPVASVVGIDPADSGEGDETGIVCGMLYHDGQAKAALTHDRSGMFTSDQWAREGVLLALEQGARVIAVEGYTAAKTYLRVVRQAYTAIHNEAVAKRKSGALLTPVEQRAMTDIPPFQIKPWRGANKADAVARAGGLSQSLETGRCRTVEGSLAVFEEQACDWQMGQHQPDRVAAAIIVHDILMEMAGAQMQIAAPVNRTPTAPPAWMRRHIGKQF